MLNYIKKLKIESVTVVFVILRPVTCKVTLIVGLTFVIFLWSVIFHPSTHRYNKI